MRLSFFSKFLVILAISSFALNLLSPGFLKYLLVADLVNFSGKQAKSVLSQVKPGATKPTNKNKCDKDSIFKQIVNPELGGEECK